MTNNFGNRLIHVLVTLHQCRLEVNVNCCYSFIIKNVNRRYHGDQYLHELQIHVGMKPDYRIYSN